MSPTSEQFQQASDPATPAQTLADLAAAHPELRPAILANPAAYDGLREWIRQQSAPVAPAPAQPAVAQPAFAQPAFAQPGYAQPAYAQPVALGAGYPAERWVEPSRRLPIRGLGYEQRYTLALVALGVAGLFRAILVPLLLPVIDQSLHSGPLGYEIVGVLYWLSDFVLAAIPSVLVGLAVLVLPSTRPRKTLAVLLALVPVLFLLIQALGMTVINLSGGIGFEIGLAVFSFLTLLSFPAAIAAWLAVRMRPGVTFALVPVVILPLVLIVALSNGFGYYYGLTPLNVVSVLVMYVVLVGVAWLARLLASRRPVASPQP